MESVLKETLGTATLKRTGQSGGGCINQGEAYITDNGTVFVKSNKKSKVSYSMFLWKCKSTWNSFNIKMLIVINKNILIIYKFKRSSK